MKHDGIMRNVIKSAVAQGWRYDRTTSGHYRFYSPDRQTIVTTSGTPSDFRGFGNFLSEMKRGGFEMQDAKTRIKYGAARKEIVAYLERNPNREVSRDELHSYLRSVLPGIAVQTFDRNYRLAGSTEGVVNTSRGMIYRPPVEKVPTSTTPAISEPVKQPTPDVHWEDDAKVLDEALEALAKVEKVIRHHREVAELLGRLLRGVVR